MLTPAATFAEFYKINKTEFHRIFLFQARRIVSREDREDFFGDVVVYFMEKQLIEKWQPVGGCSLNTYVTTYISWLYSRRVARIVRRPKLHCMDHPHIISDASAVNRGEPPQYAFVKWAEMYRGLDENERWALRHDAGLEPRYKTPSLVAYFRKRVRRKIDKCVH